MSAGAPGSAGSAVDLSSSSGLVAGAPGAVEGAPGAMRAVVSPMIVVRQRPAPAVRGKRPVPGAPLEEVKVPSVAGSVELDRWMEERADNCDDTDDVSARLERMTGIGEREPGEEDPTPTTAPTFAQLPTSAPMSAPTSAPVSAPTSAPVSARSRVPVVVPDAPADVGFDLSSEFDVIDAESMPVLYGSEEKANLFRVDLSELRNELMILVHKYQKLWKFNMPGGTAIRSPPTAGKRVAQLKEIALSRELTADEANQLSMLESYMAMVAQARNYHEIERASVSLRNDALASIDDMINNRRKKRARRAVEKE